MIPIKDNGIFHTDGNSDLGDIVKSFEEKAPSVLDELEKRGSRKNIDNELSEERSELHQLRTLQGMDGCMRLSSSEQYECRH